MSNLVIAEHNNEALGAATLNAITAATQIGGDVHVLVAGSGISAVATEAAAVAGVSKVLHADADQYKDGVSIELANLIVSLAGDYSHIMAASSTSGKDVMPRVAALLDVAQVSDIIAVDSADTFKRPIYAGNAIATVQSTDATKVLTVRPTGFDAAAAEGGSAEVASVDAVDAVGSTSVVGRELTVSERPDLGSADIVVSGGRGVYVAVGISGAIQHLAGMKDSKVIVG